MKVSRNFRVAGKPTTTGRELTSRLTQSGAGDRGLYIPLYRRGMRDCHSSPTLGQTQRPIEAYYTNVECVTAVRPPHWVRNRGLQRPVIQMRKRDCHSSPTLSQVLLERTSANASRCPGVGFGEYTYIYIYTHAAVITVTTKRLDERQIVTALVA